MSQFPTISPVSNVHPDDTTGQGPKPTDTDGDGIPDVHEIIFEEWVNFSAVDGRFGSQALIVIKKSVEIRTCEAPACYNYPAGGTP